MKNIVLSAIRFYQRSLSPHKGFCCAYAAYSGHASCSVLGYRAIRRLGVWHGMSVLNRRLEKCGIAHRRQRPGKLGRQAGFLDCSCDLPCGCDLPSGTDVCKSVSDCGSCDCDWRRRRSRDDDQYVVIPARGNVR